MNITVGTIENGAVIALEGDLDATSSPDFEKAFTAQFMGNVTRYVLDFSALKYISSAGLRVLAMALKKVKAAGGIIVICAMNDQVKKVFEISGFTPYFTICATVDEGVKAI